MCPKYQVVFLSARQSIAQRFSRLEDHNNYTTRAGHDISHVIISVSQYVYVCVYVPTCVCL